VILLREAAPDVRELRPQAAIGNSASLKAFDDLSDRTSIFLTIFLGGVHSTFFPKRDSRRRLHSLIDHRTRKRVRRLSPRLRILRAYQPAHFLPARLFLNETAHPAYQLLPSFCGLAACRV
jgi:hypothetical protein